jgi:hypothetical protein
LVATDNVNLEEATKVCDRKVEQLGENPKALGRIVVGKSSNLQEVEDGR